MEISSPCLKLHIVEKLACCIGEFSNLMTMYLIVAEKTADEGYVSLSAGRLLLTCETVDLLTIVTRLHRNTLQSVRTEL